MDWKALILNWNGTSLDDRDLVAEYVRRMFWQHNLVPPPPGAYFHEVTSDPVRFYTTHGIPNDPWLRERLDKERLTFFTEHKERVQLTPGLSNCLAACRAQGLKTALVSSELEKILTERIKQFYLLGFFNHVRPDARDREAALRETVGVLGVKPHEALYVDDISDGLLAARAVGLTPVGFVGGYGPEKAIREAQPDTDFVVMGDLIQIMRVINRKAPKNAAPTTSVL